MVRSSSQPASFQLAGNRVEPGTRARIEIPLARFYTHAPLGIPVEVFHGRRSGPTLFVSAAVHGDEINGIEIVRRLARGITPGQLRGTLLCIPIVNVPGFLAQSRYLPDGRDLNRCFPGAHEGSLAARLARLFLDEVVARASHGIDLHTGARHRANLPHIRANLDDPAVLDMARAFGVPVLVNAAIRDGSLRQAAAEMGVCTLLYEAGEALRFNERAVRAGLRGVLAVMRSLGMLKGAGERAARSTPVLARSTRWVRAPGAGIARYLLGLGEHARREQVIATIGDPFGSAEQEVLAPCDGIVIGRTNLPLVNEGDALFHVADFDDAHAVAGQVESFDGLLAAGEDGPEIV